jgi:hypothetical protein
VTKTKEKTRAHYAWIEFRRNPARADARDVRLGLVIEFVTAEYWVVGYTLFPNLEVSDLDPLSKSIVDRRETIVGEEIRKAVDKATQLGDVVQLLSANNRWAMHVTEPATVELDVKAGSANSAVAEHVLWKVLNMKSHRRSEPRNPAERRWAAPDPLQGEHSPIPEWMPPPHILQSPLVDHAE